MGLASVQNLIIVLAFACIALTAFTCTYISVTSGDSALDATKSADAAALTNTKTAGATALENTRKANNEAVDSCFSSATDSIMSRTEELLNGTAGQVNSNLKLVLDGFARNVLRWYDVISTRRPIEITTTNEYMDSLLPGFWADHRAYYRAGLTALSYFTYDNKARVFFEDTGTVFNPPDGMHHIQYSEGRGPRGEYKFGTAYPWGFNTTLDPVWDGPDPPAGYRYESDSCRPLKSENGQPAKDISPLTGKLCKWDGMRGCRGNTVYLDTNGAIDSGVCRGYWEAEDQDVTKISMAIWPVGQPRWSPVAALSSYLGISMAVVWAHPVTLRRLGVYFVALDVRSISGFLSTIKVGNDTARTRLFITVEDSWLGRRLPLPTFQQAGATVAVSHGNASTYWKQYTDVVETSTGTYQKWSWRQKVRHSRDLVDPLIRGTARHILTNVNGSYAELVGKIVSFNMNSSLAGGGWTEEVPGAPGHRYPWGSTDLGPAVNITIPYMNGRLDDSTADPLTGFARDGEEFFIGVSRLRSNPTGRTPLGSDDGELGQAEWFLTMIIDREYVLGATDRKQAQTRAVIEKNNQQIAAEVDAAEQKVSEEIAQSNAAVQDTLDEDRMILYIVVGASAVVLVVLSIFFASRIVAPIRQLQWEMAQVATMKLETVHEDRPFSALQEVGDMQKSFLCMVANLREYRSYMPASCLVDDEEAEEAPEEPGDQSEDQDEVRRESRASSRVNPELSGSRSRASMSQHSMANSQAVEKAKQALGVGLAKKPAAFMTANVVNFLLYTKAVPLPKVIEAHQKYLNVFLAATKATKGIPDLFIGDRYYASFNAVRPCPQSKVQAAKCALESRDGALEAINSVQPPNPTAVSLACTGGDVQCGNIGVEGMKKFCAIGLPNCLVHVAEAQNAVYDTSILADKKVKADAENCMLVRLMHIISQYKGTSHHLYQIIGLKTMEEDEWMYQLEAAEKADPTRVFSEAVETAYKGDIQTAIALLKEDPVRTPQHDIYLERWQEVWRSSGD